MTYMKTGACYVVALVLFRYTCEAGNTETGMGETCIFSCPKTDAGTVSSRELITSPLAGMRSIVMSLFVCLSVRSHNSKTTWSDFTKFLHVTYLRLGLPLVATLRYVMYFLFCGLFFRNDVMVRHVCIP